MKVLSSYLRKGIDVEFVELVANHPELTGYQVQVALDGWRDASTVNEAHAAADRARLLITGPGVPGFAPNGPTTTKPERASCGVPMVGAPPSCTHAAKSRIEAARVA